jgi:hypothetical protein
LYVVCRGVPLGESRTSGNRHAMNDEVPLDAGVTAQWPFGTRVCVSCVNRGDREAPVAIAGSIRFDTTKRASNQAFKTLKA